MLQKYVILFKNVCRLPTSFQFLSTVLHVNVDKSVWSSDVDGAAVSVHAVDELVYDRDEYFCLVVENLKDGLSGILYHGGHRSDAAFFAVYHLETDDFVKIEFFSGEFWQKFEGQE